MTTANSNKPNHGQPGEPPTDMELMLFFDGELDEVRHQQVEAYLLRDPGSRAKVAGLDIAAEVVRESAQSYRLADGIADAVMTRIEAAQEDGASSRSGAAVQPVTRPVLPGLAKVRALGKPPANDNSRGIFVLAAVAVAAAAAMMIWGRVEAEHPSATLTAPPKPAEVVAPQPSSELASTNVEGTEGEAGPGVEVAAVDFGARMGTVFYVPQGSAASSPTTTVVWLADNGPGGE